MPRPDKPINSGASLDGPTTSLRPQTWTKHGVMESTDPPQDDTGADVAMAGESSVQAETVEVAVDDVTVVHRMPDAIPSKYAGRMSAAHLYTDAPADPMPEPETEWVVERSIEGRTYRRIDTLTIVDDATGV